MKKAQLSIYLDPEIFANLETYANRQGKPKSLVAEAAIASFLSADDSDRREAAIAKRLDRIVRVLADEHRSALHVTRMIRDHTGRNHHLEKSILASASPGLRSVSPLPQSSDGLGSQ